MSHCLRWLAPLCLVVSALITFPACSKIFPQSSDVKVELPPLGNGGQGSHGGGGGGDNANPGNGFNGGPPGNGQPGGPGWSGPGWGGGPGQPGNGFNPNLPGPGLGNGGELLQDEFYDAQLGVKFKCVAKQCWIKKFAEGGAQGGLARMGLKVYSSAGLGSKQEFFSFERVFELERKKVGQVKPTDLRALLEKYFPSQSWEVSNKINGILGFFSRQRASGLLTEELYAPDEQDGLAKIRFAMAAGQTDDAYLGYQILHSIIVDLKAPELTDLKFSADRVAAGNSVSLMLSASDDLTGVDLDWLYQENPEHRLGDLVPADFQSWIGYDIDHSRQAYSMAYAFPLVRRDVDRIWRISADPKTFTYDLKVPEFMQGGRILLGGLRVRDVYGHETKISLEPSSGGAYLPNYSVLSGNASSLPAATTNIEAAGNPDLLPPRFTRMSVSPREIRQPEDNLCYSLEFQDEALARRLALQFTLDGTTKFTPPARCLSETTATFTRDVGKLEVCFSMAACFDQNRHSLLPKNTPIRLLAVTLFDENAQRAIQQSNLPEFLVP